MSLLRMLRLVLQFYLVHHLHLAKCGHPDPLQSYPCPPGDHDLDPCKCIIDVNHPNYLWTIACIGSSNLTTMDDVETILNNVEYYPSTQAYSMTITGTNISGFLEDIWDPLQFQQINLYNNKLEFVSKRAFYSTKDTLVHVNLDHNEIVDVQWGVLYGLPKLASFHLFHNQLSFIASDVMPISYVKHLFLNSNNIEFVGENSFAELRNLSLLELSNNRLTMMKDNMLRMPHNHRSLQVYLDNNKIDYVNPNAFIEAPLIHLLDLRNNSLTMLNEYDFMPLIEANIDDLIIHTDGNPIKCNCNIAWIKDPQIIELFSDFGCYDDDGVPTGKTFDTLPDNFFDDCNHISSRGRC